MSAPWQQPVPPQPPARKTSLVGPVVLTGVGALLLVGTLVAAVVTAGVFLGAVRSDVLTPDGRPGAAVLASAPAPGAASVELTAGERYAVYLVVPRDSLRDGESPSLEEDVLLMAPSGEVVRADDAPGVTMNEGMGDLRAGTVGAFLAPQTGTYQMAVPPAGVDGAWVALAPDRAFAPFFGAIGGTVLGVFVVIGLGGAGLGALVAGIVWWVVRARARRQVAPA